MFANANCLRAALFESPFLRHARLFSDSRLKAMMKAQPTQVRRPGTILDKFIPIEGKLMPSILSTRGWRSRWTNLKSNIFSTLRCLHSLSQMGILCQLE